MRLKKSFIEVLLTLAIISWTTFTYALLADIKVSDWNQLTSTLWNNLVDHSVPSWAVMSFDLETCPTWWIEYTALQWKFIRWADTWAVNDPDFDSRVWWVWARKIWSTQEWEVWPHNHPIDTALWTSGTSARYAYWDWASFDRKRLTDLSTGSETRPTNVYLLYCKKD